MLDVQNHEYHRNFAIDKVGVCDIRYPIIVLDRKDKKQHTVGKLTLWVDLPHHFKGTHMSRFLEVLNNHHGEITFLTLPAILKELRSRLNAQSSHIEISFPYFLERRAPVTQSSALMDFDCRFVAE